MFGRAVQVRTIGFRVMADTVGREGEEGGGRRDKVTERSVSTLSSWGGRYDSSSSVYTTCVPVGPSFTLQRRPPMCRAVYECVLLRVHSSCSEVD